MSSCSESRTPYTQNESLLLASLVDKHGSVIENKRTDAHTIQEKHQEWEKVAVEYNAQATLISAKPTSTQLKKLWNNLKQRKRKATTELKYQRLLTGGGPEPVPAVEEDVVMEAVDIAAPHVDVTLPCIWDSTAGVYEARHAEQTAAVSTEHQGVIRERRNEAEQLISPRTTTVIIAAPKTSTATSAASTQSCSKTGEKEVTSGATKLIKKESELRMQKMQDSIEQQKELHSIKMKIGSEQLQAAIAARRNVEAEAEVAELQLKIFRKQNNLLL